MKKLLVLMLVLGLVSVANAALVRLDADATSPKNTTVDVCGTVTIVVAGPVADYRVYLDITPGDCLVSGPTAVVLHQPPAGNQSSASVWSDYGTYKEATLTAASTSTPSDQIAGDHFTTTIDCSCLMEDYGQVCALVEIYGGNDPYPLVDSITLRCIPEPMTIGLLGLGGLLLRRRK